MFWYWQWKYPHIRVESLGWQVFPQIGSLPIGKESKVTIEDFKPSKGGKSHMGSKVNVELAQLKALDNLTSWVIDLLTRFFYLDQVMKREKLRKVEKNVIPLLGRFWWVCACPGPWRVIERTIQFKMHLKRSTDEVPFRLKMERK